LFAAKNSETYSRDQNSERKTVTPTRNNNNVAANFKQVEIEIRKVSRQILNKWKLKSEKSLSGNPPLGYAK